jgi:hypothetical protein
VQCDEVLEGAEGNSNEFGILLLYSPWRQGKGSVQPSGLLESTCSVHTLSEER